MIQDKSIPEGFERLIKYGAQSQLPKRTISVNSGSITISQDMMKIIKNKGEFFGLEVLINRNNKKILLIPSNDKDISFKFGVPWKNNSNRVYKSNMIFTSKIKQENIKTGYYNAKINLGIIEFTYKLNQPKEKFIIETDVPAKEFEKMYKLGKQLNQPKIEE